jgi:hypothetical protein
LEIHLENVQSIVRMMGFDEGDVEFNKWIIDV